jgi:uncharacterized protein (TIGR00299 family) protein
MRLAYFDCFSGASGDMILGALLDAGLPLDQLRGDIASLGLRGVDVAAEKVSRQGVTATAFHVIVRDPHHDHGHDDHGHHHGRGLRDILDLIAAADLPGPVTSGASRIFDRLAEVEAAVHGVAVESVHFHEVGAVDSIVDIVGAAAGLYRLGVERVCFSRLALGRGYVDCAHGRLPVPSPATAALVQGIEVDCGAADGELLTPTGAAILTTLGKQAAPAMRPAAVGYGAGGRDRPGTPNVLRVWIGEEADSRGEDAVWVIETNVDDCSPEVIGYALDRLWAAGALDVFVTPIQMKKGRPGAKVTALARTEGVTAVEDVLFHETTTFGVRRYQAVRSVLDRTVRTVATPYGPVRVKEGRRGGRVISREPEYEDCRRVAEAQGLPVRDVMDTVRRLATESSP